MQQHPELPQAFAQLGLEVRFLEAVAKMGFETPSDIQARLIPVALEGHDVLGQARTGTGKTGAFALPILQQIDPAGRLQALCLAPTRELAVQVAAETKRLAHFADIHVVAVYGGQKVATQAHLLGRRHHFVVGTPGRVMDFINRGVLDLSDLRFAVLDEVDRMLDIGFRDDIRDILRRIKSKHQTIFVSATIDDEIRRLAKTYMHEPVELDVSQDRMTVDEVTQSYVSVEPWDKFHVLRMILKQENEPVAIVFCNTKAGARKLAQKLHDVGMNAKEIHGDLVQQKRDRVMDQFRRHQVKILVATDLAARGIDVSAISHIFNYDIPPDPEVYVHRIGRTARMGAKGAAVTFVTSEQGKEITQIEMLINREVPERKVEGFVPRPPRDDFSPRPGRSGPSSQVGDAQPVETVSKPAGPPKTLGGRFRPARSRRRR